MKKFITFISIFFIFLIEICTIQAQCLKSDSLELVELYRATNGYKWKNTWDLSKPVHTWHGIKLTDDGCHVKTIHLSGYYGSPYGLNGYIPNFNLPYLEVLNLARNQLIGAIPNFNLPHLKSLNLYHNQLSGSIPNFNNLPKLHGLFLDNNQLSGAIPNFKKLNLCLLSLNHNAFTFEGIEQNLRKRTEYPPYFMNSSVSHKNEIKGFSRLNFSKIDWDFMCGTNRWYTFNYENQDTIPIYKNAKGDLYVKAGGGTSKNTYYWYKDGKKYRTIVGDSLLFAPRESGTYYCKVTNREVTIKRYCLMDGCLFLPNQNLILRSAEVSVQPAKNNCDKKGFENKGFDDIAIFPNPAKENLFIRLKGVKGKRVSIQVLDRLGKVHLAHSIKLTDTTIKVDVNSLSNGFYVVRIQLEGRPVKTKTLIISN